MSGNFWLSYGVLDNRTYYSYSRKLAEIYNCPKNSSLATVDCLRKLNVTQLVNTRSVFERTLLEMKERWGPTIEPVDSEDAFLTDNPLEVIKGGHMSDRSFILGTVGDEGLMYAMDMIANETVFNKYIAQLEILIKYCLEIHVIKEKAASLVNTVKSYYFKDMTLEDRNATALRFSDFFTDAFFNYPLVKVSRYYLQNARNPFFVYNFNYRGTFSRTSSRVQNNEYYGVTHADELTYIFPIEPERFSQPELRMSDVDHIMIDLMVDLWTSFATTGIPATTRIEEPFVWKPYTQDRNYLVIGDGNRATLKHSQEYFEERMNFWKNICA